MPAGKPGVLVDHRSHQLRNLGIAALPQRAKGTRRADDWQIADVVALGDLGQLVGHAGAAGDPGDQAGRVLEHAFEYFLRPAHLPQHVDVDRTPPAGDVMCALHLFGGAIDGVANQLHVSFLASQRVVDLRDDLALGVVAVGVDRADRADPACSGPGARTSVV